jgi:hypothetical protein
LRAAARRAASSRSIRSRRRRSFSSVRWAIGAEA